MNTQIAINSCAVHVGHPGTDLQKPFDVAVVMPTILRPLIGRALRSVFAQKGCGRIQILIGVDKARHPRTILDEIAKEVPETCVLTVFDLGYSTSARHGGVHSAFDGGSLRTALSFLANSRHIAYLDDDNWWAENHLATLLSALQYKDWAFSLRWYVDQTTSVPLSIDRWESIGPGRGGYNDAFGGWSDPNTLLIDKIRCADVLPLWSKPLPSDNTQLTADRNVFHALRTRYTWGATNDPTCFYTIDPKDPAHAARLRFMARDKEVS